MQSSLTELNKQRLQQPGKTPPKAAEQSHRLLSPSALKAGLDSLPKEKASRGLAKKPSCSTWEVSVITLSPTESTLQGHSAVRSLADRCFLPDSLLRSGYFRAPSFAGYLFPSEILQIPLLPSGPHHPWPSESCCPHPAAQALPTSKELLRPVFKPAHCACWEG